MGFDVCAAAWVAETRLSGCRGLWESDCARKVRFSERRRWPLTDAKRTLTR